MLNFDNLIDKHISRELRAKQEGRYYPSEIGSCMRKVWYSYKDPRPIRVDLQKIFEVGNILHDFVAEVLRSEKNPEVELLKSELPFKISMNSFTISGRVDDLLLVKASGRQLLVEVKSTSRIDFVTEAKPENVMQLQLYMHATGVHNGVLLYIDKRNLKTKSFTIPFNEGVAAIALNRFNELHKHLTEEILPEAEARASRKEDIGWMCRMCDWRERCFKDTPESELR
ncbi:MAG: PD-(D/E)XK nuclease family protein [Candidatus Aenigmatarchaeota archaeon]